MKTVDKRKPKKGGRIKVIDQFIPVRMVIKERKDGKLVGELQGFVTKSHYESESKMIPIKKVENIMAKPIMAELDYRTFSCGDCGEKLTYLGVSTHKCPVDGKEAIP